MTPEKSSEAVEYFLLNPNETLERPLMRKVVDGDSDSPGPLYILFVRIDDKETEIILKSLRWEKTPRLENGKYDVYVSSNLRVVKLTAEELRIELPK